ncbi:AzlD domain-containing protein [Noviherbaspirillum aridicola]|uniref:Membrane protein n=1 Tax=Noviherbaspirillum aridicola TaxID=2849687 RepID=A0ABQ4Q8G0_9BURK|nr:AzlD domain-containing protein [Noviherbaspirillum aridicola]GIZ53197.1 membrane protein [Noviherbaspirillum aridicola]
MNAPDTWLTILLLTLATIITRGTFYLLGHAVRLPPRVQHALRYAPAAALAAIVVPDLVLADGALHLSVFNPKLMAGIGATVFFLVTRHLLYTIIVGMALFTIFRLVF